MRRASPSRAGVLYVAVVFAAGFALGTLRVLVIVPAVGETAAVLIETPLMLAASWFAAGAIAGWMAIPAAAGPRLAMGGVAFALLMALEVGVSTLAFGRSLAAHFAAYQTLPAQIGLAGQVAFGLCPLLRIWGRKTAATNKPST